MVTQGDVGPTGCGPGTSLYIQQGATYTLTVTYQDADAVPIDLTGFEAHMQSRVTYDSTDAILDIHSTDIAPTYLEIVAVDGQVIVHIGPTVSGALTRGRYVYELIIISPANDVTSLLKGDLVVVPGIVRGA